MNYNFKSIGKWLVKRSQRKSILDNDDTTTVSIKRDIHENRLIIAEKLAKNVLKPGSGVSDLYCGLDLDMRLVQADLMNQDDTFNPNLSSYHLINGSFYDSYDDDLLGRLQLMTALTRCDFRVYPVITEREILNTGGRLYMSVTFGQQTHEFFALKPSPMVANGVNHLIFIGTTEKRINLQSFSRISIVPFLLL